VVLTDTNAVPDTPTTHGRIPADNLPAIAERYRGGESLVSIGKSYGVSDEAVRRRLEKWALACSGEGKPYDLATDYLIENAIAAKDRIVVAPDAVGIARAREETKYWLWMLERRRPKLFGPRQQIDMDKTVTVIVRRGGSPPVPVSADIPATLLPDCSTEGAGTDDAA
jgi:hypothetical protein